MRRRRKTALACLAAAWTLTVSATTVTWDFPRETSCHEGLAFSDGTTGVLVWGGGDEIRLTVGRSDLWDHRGGYDWLASQSYSNIIALVRAGKDDELVGLFRNEPPPGWNGRYNPYMLPLGRLAVKIPGGTLARGELDTETGLGRLILSDGRVLSLAMSRLAHVFALKLPQGLEPVSRVVPATDFPIYGETLKGRGFEKARMTSDGFTWRLPADPSVSLEHEVHPETDGCSVFLWTRREEPFPPSRRTSLAFDGIAADSRAQWRDFWTEGARVKLPDPVLQRVYDYGMYRFGAMTDPDGVPAGLQGPWLEDDRLVPWNGDYHFNINVQECYSPAFRGGHFRNLLPLFRMLLSWRPTLRDNAKKFVGIDDGYVLPHSVDDRGVCIGGFWSGTIDHASAAWVAAMMMRYVRYAGDVSFLREGGYDFMKGAMNVYRAMLEEKDGRLSLPLGPSPEWGASDMRKCVGRDPSFQLAAAHRLARDLVDAAGLLGETPDPMWLDVDRRLPAYTAGAGGIHLFEGQPFEQSHRHHSHLAGYYPFDTIDVAETRANGVLGNSYATWVMRGTGMWTGWCVPWAAVLNVHFGQSRAAVRLLQDWDAFFCDEGHGSHHDAWTPGFTVRTWNREIMQMDGQCAAAAAILELLAHEVNGRTEYFRGCPLDWKDVSFENLALSDGTRVNGRRKDGKVVVMPLQKGAKACLAQ